MLGCAFPPFHSGILAAFAFVPFLIMFESLDRYGEAIRTSYAWMFTLHLVTLYWTGGFTHGKDIYLMIAGAALLVFHPLFYVPVILAFVFFRRRYGFKQAIIVFPFLWITMEFLLSKGELSFPWLTLGNTQTYDLDAIQIASFTGVYGISLWLLWINVLTYGLYRKLITREVRIGTRAIVLRVGTIVLLFLIPKIYGIYRESLREFCYENHRILEHR